MNNITILKNNGIRLSMNGLDAMSNFVDRCASFLNYLFCFPVYKDRQTNASSYFVMDHIHLAYLNIIKKCIACNVPM